MKQPPLFNCSNDMALAANVRQYFPPKRIQQMENDLKDLAQYWDEGPWGWSLNTKQRYRKMGVAEEDLPGDEWLAEVRRLSNREYATLHCPKNIPAEKGNVIQFVGEQKYVDGRNVDIQEFVHSLMQDKEQTWIFKSPWSSSGRGVFTSHRLTEELIVKKLQGFINTQGGFIYDKFYDKNLDFAMEFYVHEDHTVDFLGYSVFHAEENGAYGYNTVADQHTLRALISKDCDRLTPLIAYHKEHLAKTSYHGPVGIDMLVCKDGRIHPCIEINFRMNMGILAILLYDRFGPNANVQLTPHREHGFEAKIEEGKLAITYTPQFPKMEGI